MYGYPVESHTVVTSDGYILDLDRIPSGKQGTGNGKIALLVPGLWSTSLQWVLTGAGNGLGTYIKIFYFFK